MTIERFEDLELWQLSRTLVKHIYKITSGSTLDLNHICKSEFDEYFELTEKVSKSIAGFIKYLQSLIKNKVRWAMPILQKNESYQWSMCGEKI